MPTISIGQKYDLNNVNSTEETKTLWNYLHSVYGNKMLTAGMTEYLFGGNNNIKNCTGKYPAIFGHDVNSWYQDRNEYLWTVTWEKNINELKNAHRRGQIIQLSWHWQNPNSLVNGVYTSDKGAWSELTEQQWEDIVTPGTDLYNTMIEDIDYHVDNLLKLVVDDEGNPIPMLWRPFHEIDGGWFWWTCKSDPTKSVKLWNILYDRIQNHHKMNNLIWIWSNSVECTGGSRPPFLPSEYARRKLFYPGDEKCDIVGIDLYGFHPIERGTYRAETPKTYRDSWNLLKNITSEKMIALTEAEGIPDASKFFDEDYAPWLFALPWFADKYTEDKTDYPLCGWNNIQFNHSNYITIDEITLSTNTYLAIDIQIYPNPAKDIIYINNANTTINTLNLYNSEGKQVLKSYKTDNLNISNLKNGIYFIEIETDRGNLIKKILKK